LITGISDAKHSFQIGFDHGDIVLLSYRVVKGSAALDNIALIHRAKVSRHPTTDTPQLQSGLPITSDILSRLTSTPSDTETDLSHITVPAPKQEHDTSTSRVTDSRLKKSIEAAAIHHFGPIGAMVCEEHLTHTAINDADFESLMLRIAADVGASEVDVQAFVDTVIR
jgi:hypothetical protein